MSDDCEHKQISGSVCVRRLDAYCPQTAYVTLCEDQSQKNYFRQKFLANFKDKYCIRALYILVIAGLRWLLEALLRHFKCECFGQCMESVRNFFNVNNTGSACAISRVQKSC